MFGIATELKTLFSYCRCTTGSRLVQALRSGVSSFPGHRMQDAAVYPRQ